MIWGWVNDERNVIFRWIMPLIRLDTFIIITSLISRVQNLHTKKEKKSFLFTRHVYAKHNWKAEKFASEVWTTFQLNQPSCWNLPLDKCLMKVYSSTKFLSKLVCVNCEGERNSWDLPKWGSPGEIELSAEVKVYAGQQIMGKLQLLFFLLFLSLWLFFFVSGHLWLRSDWISVGRLFLQWAHLVSVYCGLRIAIKVVRALTGAICF